MLKDTKKPGAAGEVILVRIDKISDLLRLASATDDTLRDIAVRVLREQLALPANRPSIN